MGFTIIFTLLSVILYCYADNGGVRIDLKKMKTPLEGMAEMGVHPSKIHAILQKIKTQNVSVPLFKFLDGEFYGEVLIGHPGQKFNVIFDTNWANSWVPSSLCGATNIACRIHNQYDCTRSSTYIPNGEDFNVTLGKSALVGRLSTDLVHFGQINVTNQTFAEIFHVPWFAMFTKADGIFGLAFEKLAVDNVKPFFYNMLAQGTVLRPIFSFYMNRDPSSKRAGTLFLGGIEEKHYLGNFTYAPVKNTGYWQFRMDSVNVKGSNMTFCKGGCDTLADTSSIRINGPKNDILYINQLIEARPFYFDLFIVDCGRIGTLPHMSFNIAGRSFPMKPQDYIQKVSWGGVMFCLSTFAISDSDMWVLGGAFLSRFYVTYDLENFRIGIADARL